MKYRGEGITVILAVLIVVLIVGLSCVVVADVHGCGGVPAMHYVHGHCVAN